jgi:hypothetical protein
MANTPPIAFGSCAKGADRQQVCDNSDTQARARQHFSRPFLPCIVPEDVVSVFSFLCGTECSIINALWSDGIGPISRTGVSMRHNPQQRSTAALTVCWGAWIGGTILIVLSWCGVVPNEIGWIGWGIAGIAALISYVPSISSPAVSQSGTEGGFALTDPMLNAQDRHYQTALDQFGQGATLIYRGVGFALCEPNEIAAALMASHPAADMDDNRVLVDAEHARKAFEDLEQRSSHFAFAVRDRAFRTSLFCDYGNERVEICRIRGDSIRWLIDRKEHGGSSISESVTARRPWQ